MGEARKLALFISRGTGAYSVTKAFTRPCRALGGVVLAVT